MFLTLADKFDSAHGTDHPFLRPKTKSPARLSPLSRLHGRKFGEIQTIVEDTDFWGGRKLAGNGLRNTDHLLGEAQDVTGIRTPEEPKLLKPIPNMPDMRNAGTFG